MLVFPLSHTINHITVFLGFRLAVILCHRQAPVNHENPSHGHFMLVTSACVIGLLMRKGLAFQLRPGDPSH